MMVKMIMRAINKNDTNGTQSRIDDNEESDNKIQQESMSIP